MAKGKFLLLFVACIWLSVNTALTQQLAQADEQTVARLRNFRVGYAASLLNKKPESLASYYADDVRLMPEFQKTIIGRRYAFAYHRAFTDRFKLQAFSRNEIEILVLGSRLVELGVFTMKVKARSSGKQVELQGKYQDYWEKRANSELVVITQAWNYSHPVEIANLLRFEQVPVTEVALAAHVPIASPISFELAALNTLLEEAITQHDATLWSRFYAEDAKWAYSNHPLYEGRTALTGFLEQHVKELPVFEKLDIRNDRIDDLGDYVIEYASHLANWRNGNDSGVSTGKNIVIWRREKDCSLKIFRGIAMYD